MVLDKKAIILVGFLLFLGIGIYFAVSKSPKTTQEPNLSQDPTLIDFETIAQGDGATITGSFANDENQKIHFFIFANEKSWIEFWNRIYKSTTPRPPLPTVDFKEDNVLFVATSLRPSAGFDLKIQDIRWQNKNLQANLIETQAGQGCATADVLTRPFHAVKFKKATIDYADYDLQIETIPCN